MIAKSSLLAIVSLMVFLLPPAARAVDCSSDLITLTTQQQVSDFQAVYGPCDTVRTGLTIDGASINDLTPLMGLITVSTVGPFSFDHLLRVSNTSLASLAGLDNLLSVYWIELTNNTALTDLSALSSLAFVRGPFAINGNTTLTSVNGLEGITALTGGALLIENNLLLSDLSGLSNLSSIAASLVIGNNDSLLNLDAFAGLTQVASNISVSQNDQLTDLAGLGGLVGFDETLNVRFNNQLSSLGDLSNISELGGLVIRSNNALTSLDGLGNLTILGNNTALAVDSNNSLTSIAALSNVVGAAFDVEFSDNPMLADCTALQTLLDDVDDADPGPGPGDSGIPDVGGEVTIENNLPGCNSVQEIVDGVDMTAPEVMAPADLSMAASATLTEVTLGSATVTDNSGEQLTATPDNMGPFPVGDTVVTWTAVDSSGNSGTDTQTVTVTPPQILVSDRGRAVVDGVISYGEWDNAARFNLQNGYLSFTHFRDRLYVLINVLDDDGDDPFASDGGDQFWLLFDVDEDGQITPDVDLRFRLESGTGNLRKQSFCDGCLLDFNPLQSEIYSSRGEGFGCFIDDGSLQIPSLNCQSHRVWEVALDLTELDMRADKSVGFAYLVASGDPLFSENLPPDVLDVSSYGRLTLQGLVHADGSGPGQVTPQFEVTQAIQTPDNELDLVAGKTTAVRIWDGNNSSPVRAFVYGSRNGIDLPGSPLFDAARLSDVNSDRSRDSINNNAFVVLQDGWTTPGPVNFGILIQGLDNSVAATAGATLDFVTTRTPVFWTVPLRMEYAAANPVQVAANRITLAEEWLQELAPIQDIDLVRRPLLTVTDVTTSNRLKEVLNGYDQLNILAWVLGLAANGTPPFTLPEQTTGFSPVSFTAGTRTIGGSSDRIGRGGRGRITWVRASASATSMTYAHELNHNLDQATTSTWGLHSRGCNAQGGGALDGSWPYGNQFNIIETGVAPNALPFTSVSPTTPDFMSYCFGSRTPRQWWSPYRWEAWLDEFRTPQNKVVDTVDHKGQMAEDSFYAQFRVYPEGSGELTQIMRQPGIPDPVGTGVYQFSIKDCSGAVLYSAGFSASFVGDEGEDENFVALAPVTPAPNEACEFELSLDGSVLDSRLISPAAPVATLISPNGGESFAGVETVMWTGSDADADDLTYALLYSADDGATWQAVANAIEGTELAVDFSELPGSSDARMRVLVTDGANTSVDDSDAAFQVADAKPVVEITMPLEGESVAADAPVQLRGVARATGLPVAQEQLTWLIDGSVAGTGETLTAYLPAGDHEIGLQAAPPGMPLATTTISVQAGGPPGIGFETGLVEVNENEGEAVLVVQRSGEAAGSAAVTFFTSDGTATGGATGEADFVAVPQADDARLEWGENDAGMRAITITLNVDNQPEGPESFTVNLQAVDGETLDLQSTTVRIRANDPGLVFVDGFED